MDCHGGLSWPADPFGDNTVIGVLRKWHAIDSSVLDGFFHLFVVVSYVLETLVKIIAGS